MASCGLCSSFGRTKLEYNHDLARVHAETHFMQMKIIDDGITTDQIFEKYFPDFGRTASSGRKDLNALCRTLFSKKSLTSSFRHVICEICHDGVRIIGQKKDLLSNAIIEHACYHLRLNIYECRQCVQEFRSSSSLKAHMVTNHQLRTSIGHYRSKVNDFVGEISAMLKSCFGSRRTLPPSIEFTISSTSASKIRGHTKGSHLAIERQLFCYRLIRKVVDRNGKVQCHICSKGIRVTDRKNFFCESVRDHAYRHLPMPLFRCRLCSEAYHSRSAVDKHLQTVHALPRLKQNFECLADQHHSDILAVINKCYGTENDSGKKIAFRNLSESTVQIRKKSIESELTARRRILCFRLIRKCASAERIVQCRLCSKQISANTGKSLKTGRVIQHALLHVGKEMYQCVKCSKKFITHGGVSSHLKKKHALSSDRTHYQYFADRFHGDIVRVLRQCYGEEGNQDGDDLEEVRASIQREPSNSASVVSSRLTVERRSLCNQLIQKHSDQTDKKLQCRICNRRISVKGSTGVCNDTAMSHALVHLDKPMYRCKICSKMFVRRGGIRNHVTRQHALTAINNYDCFGDQFHAEIVEMLRKCYNKESAVEAMPFKNQIWTEAIIRKNVNGSKQKIERQRFCYRLLRKFVKSDGKVDCRVCKKRIAAMNGETYQCNSAMLHINVHLKKPIYRCAVCSEKRPNKASISFHLKKTHSLPVAKNYELSDEYHSEILAQLRECYGEL